jgi:hypothetical protein
MRVQLKESMKMNSLVMPRRAFLKGLVGLIAAPAIVRASSLMPVKAWVEALAPESILPFAELTELQRRQQKWVTWNYMFSDSIADPLDLDDRLAMWRAIPEDIRGEWHDDWGLGSDD